MGKRQHHPWGTAFSFRWAGVVAAFTLLRAGVAFLLPPFGCGACLLCPRGWSCPPLLPPFGWWCGLLLAGHPNRFSTQKRFSANNYFVLFFFRVSSFVVFRFLFLVLCYYSFSYSSCFVRCLRFLLHSLSCHIIFPFLVIGLLFSCFVFGF